MPGADCSYLRTPKGLYLLWTTLVAILSDALVWFLYDNTVCLPDEPMILPMPKNTYFCSNGWVSRHGHGGARILFWGLFLLVLLLLTFAQLLINFCFQQDLPVLQKRNWRRVTHWGWIAVGVITMLVACFGLYPVLKLQVFLMHSDDCLAVALLDTGVSCEADKIEVAVLAFVSSCGLGVLLIFMGKSIPTGTEPGTSGSTRGNRGKSADRGAFMDPTDDDGNESQEVRNSMSV